jgi:hypothetical protein
VLVVWLLARVSGFRTEHVVLLAFCGFGSFYVNFALGQYYVAILFLLTLALYSLEKRCLLTAGALCAIAFGLKLYGGPFFLYFAARRNWRAFAGMAATSVVLAAVAIGLFGWDDVAWYATQVLPRSLEGGSVDPYHPANATISTLLRRTFMFEPELNPHPFLNAPGAFFFLRTFVLLSVLVVALLALNGNRAGSERRAFAWFTIVMLLLSTSTTRYTFLLVLLPLVPLLEETTARMRVLLIGSFALLGLPLPFGSWFPKVGLLLFLYFVAGREFWRGLRPRRVLVAVALVAAIAAFDAAMHLRSYAREPGRRFSAFATEEGQVFSSFPVATPSGVFFQTMDKRRYALAWSRGATLEKIPFDGSALVPRLAGPDGRVQFDLAANGTSRPMEFDPRSGITSPAASVQRREDSAVSPDGRWVAFVPARRGPQNLMLRNAATGEVRELAGGNCNSTAPAWEPDSKALIFASDCDRAFGTPVLYRAKLEEILRIPAR